MITFRGRVLAPDGKPAAGAGVYTVATRSSEGWAEPVLKSRAGADGSFRFTLPRAELAGAGVDRPWSMVTVVADADGLGPDWVELKQPPDGELVLRLVDDPVPIAGRILDLQGRPVVGAKVTLSRIVGGRRRRYRPLSEAAPRGSVPGIESSLRQELLGGHEAARPAGERHDRRRRPVPPDRHRPRPHRRDRRRGADDPERHDHRDDPQRGGGLHAEGCLRSQDGLRRNLRPPHPARPRPDRRRPRQADGAAPGRRDRRRHGDEREGEDRRRGTVHPDRIPQGEELRADGPGGREASVFRDLPRRARCRPASIPSGRTSIACRASRCGSS